MADPHFTVERVLEKFGTREALIDFLLDTEDIDNPKKKLINTFVRFRMVYNAVLPKSTSRLQNVVSKDAGKAWDEEKVQNAVFWDDLDRDFLAEHRARFPYYWYINSLPPAERKALLDTVPDPKTRSKKRSDSDAERKQTPRDRAAPYTVPGSSSSSRSSSSRLSSSRGSRAARSSESYSLPNTSQASSSAGPLFPSPPAVPVHPSTYPSTPAVYPYPHPPVPVYPSIQPSHAMIPPDGYMGRQTPGVAYPTALAYGNTSLNGGQYMAQPPKYPVPVPAPYPRSLDMQMQNHPTWTDAATEPAASYLQPLTVTTTHSACQWTTSTNATVPAVPYYPQLTTLMTQAAPLVPYREADFGYGPYQHQLGVGGDAPFSPAPDAPGPFPPLH